MCASCQLGRHAGGTRAEVDLRVRREQRREARQLRERLAPVLGRELAVVALDDAMHS